MKIALSDLAPGKWFWLSVDTACNGEAHTSCMARVESIEDKAVILKLFGNHEGGFLSTSRGQKFTVRLNDVETSLFELDLDRAQMEEILQREANWVHDQRQFLDTYESDLLEVS